MELQDLIKKLMECIKQKEGITEEILNKNISLASSQKEYRHKMGLELIRLREEKTPTVIINKIAEGHLRAYMEEIEIQEYQIRYLKDKLENIRQNIEVYRSLIKNERELINL